MSNLSDVFIYAIAYSVVLTIIALPNAPTIYKKLTLFFTHLLFGAFWIFVLFYLTGLNIWLCLFIIFIVPAIPIINVIYFFSQIAFGTVVSSILNVFEKIKKEAEEVLAIVVSSLKTMRARNRKS